MKRYLLKIILYLSITCLVIITTGMGWLYLSLSDKDGVSSDYIKTFVVEEFNSNSSTVKLSSDTMSVKFFEGKIFLHITAKNMKITNKGAPLARFDDIQISISIWHLLLGNVKMDKIVAQGGMLEYEDAKMQSNVAVAEISEKIVKSILGISEVMQGLEKVELSNIDLRYFVTGSPLAVVSKSANILFLKKDNFVSVEFLGVLLGRDSNAKLIKTDMLLSTVKISDYWKDDVTVRAKVEGIDSNFDWEVVGRYNMPSKIASVQMSLRASDVQVVKYLGVLPKGFPSIGDVNLELKANDYNLNTGGKIALAGIVDEHPIGGAVIVRKNAFADIDLKVTDITSEVLHKYWPEKFSSYSRNWIYKNIIGSYSASFKTTVDLLNEFAISPPTVTLELKNALVNYYNPLPVAKVTKAIGTYDKNGFYITIENGEINTAKEKLNIDGATIKIITKGASDTKLTFKSNVKANTNLVLSFLNAPVINVALPHKDLNAIKGNVNALLTIESNVTKDTVDSVSFDGSITSLKLKKYDNFEKISSNKVNISFFDGTLSLLGDISFDGGSEGILKLKNKLANTRIDYNGMLSSKSIRRFIKNTVIFDKPAKVKLQYSKNKNDLDVDLYANLNNTNISIPAIDWKNSLGRKNTVILKIKVKKDDYKITGEIGVKGDKNIFIKGSISGDKKGFSSISIPKVKFGAGKLSIQGSRQKSVFKLSVKGRDVYTKVMRSVLESIPDSYIRQPMDIDVNMSNVYTHLGMIGDQVILRIKSKVNGYDKIWMHLQTSRPKTRSLISYGKNGMRVYSENIGVMYGFLTGEEPVKGGAITMMGKRTKAGTINGDLYVKDLTVLDVPESTRILKVFSVVGILDAVKTKYIDFKSMRGKFSLKEGRFVTENISAVGKNIAVSAKGYIDFHKEKLNLKGMILPSHQLGNFIGKIPVIGAILSGVDKQGPVTQTYTAKGGFKDYRVDVNSSGIFTVGVLRNIFSVLTGAEDVPVIFTKEELEAK